MQEQIDIAVIGGTGLYAMPGISDRSSLRISTPWGDPSGDIVVGTLHGKRVAFLPRHGTGHRLGPSLVPYRANIYALKSLGVRFIISVNACGSLREDYQPGHIVVPDQLYDNTRGLRPATFFERDLVSHISVAQPFCDTLRGILGRSVASSGGYRPRRRHFPHYRGATFQHTRRKPDFPPVGLQHHRHDHLS